jgi:hypothetical protein
MSDKRQEEANALGREQAIKHKAGTAGARRAEARAAFEHDANELIACSALEVVWTLDGRKRVIASADLETVSEVKVALLRFVWLGDREEGLTKEDFWTWLEDRLNKEAAAEEQERSR